MNFKSKKSLLACAVLASVLAGGFGLSVSRAEAANFTYSIDGAPPVVWDGAYDLKLNEKSSTGTKLEVWGEGASTSNRVYGGCYGDGTNVSGKEVDFYSGMIGYLYGGYSIDGTATYNTVNFAGGTVSYSIMGGYTYCDGGDASNNTVTFSGGSALNIYGGYIHSGKAGENTINFNGGSVTTIKGGDSAASGEVSKNIINIDGGTVKYVQGGVSGGIVKANEVMITNGTIKDDNEIYGGESRYNKATENKVTISGGTFGSNTTVYGGHSGSGITEQNTVTISGGTFGSNTTVYGGYSTNNVTANTITISDATFGNNTKIQGGYSENGNVTGNNVTIENITFTGLTYVRGGYSENGSTLNNILTITGSSFDSSSNDYIYGGDAETLARGNKVHLTNANFRYAIYGGYALNTEGNEVTISGGTISGMDFIESKSGIFGGYDKGSGNSTAKDNAVTISDGNVIGKIVGGRATNVINNKVTINGGTFGGTAGIFSGIAVYGGIAMSELFEREMTGNTVTITGGNFGSGAIICGGYFSPVGDPYPDQPILDNKVTISGGIFGGNTKIYGVYSEKDNYNATGNIVTISGGTFGEGTVIYGSYSVDNAISEVRGNKVIVSGGDLSRAEVYGHNYTGNEYKNNGLQIENTTAIKKIGGFENIDFVLPAGIADNATMLTLANAVSLNGVTVNIYLNGQSLDTITLISNVTNPATSYPVYNGNSGTDANADYEVTVENSALVLKSLQSLWYTVGDVEYKDKPGDTVKNITNVTGDVTVYRGTKTDNAYGTIDAAGHTVTIAGDNPITVTGALTAASVVVAEGKGLIINASNLKITGTDGLVNTGKTVLNGGTLSCNITTTKQTGSDLEIEGVVLNNAEITQNGIRIKGSGTSFTTDADKIHTGQVDMLGGAVLNLTGGTIDFNITNEENTTAKIVENATVEMSSSGRVGNLQVAGTLDMNGQTNKVTNLDITATGTLNLKNNAYETVVFENLTVAEGATVNFDAKFDGIGDQISATTASGTLTLGSIGLNEGFDGDAGSIKTITFLINGAANITLTGSSETVFGAYKYSFVRGTDSGTLKVTKDIGFSLVDIINDRVDNHVAGQVSNYSLNGDKTMDADMGTLTRPDSKVAREFTINGNKNKLLGGNKAGITVKTGDTLTYKDIAEVSGFNGAAVINNGTFNANNVTLKNEIAGSGIMNVDGVVNADAKVANKMNVAGTGTLNIAADNLKNAVTNNGTVNLGAGTLATGNTITGGTFNITGDVTANASDIAGETNTIAANKTLTLSGGNLAHNISGGKVVVQGNVTTTADYLSREYEIAADKKLTVNDGTLQYSALNITGTGKLAVNGTTVLQATTDIFEVKDAKQESALSITANNIAFVGGTLSITGVESYSLDYYNSITALLKEQGNTSLQMSGAIYIPEGNHSGEEVKISGNVQFGGETLLEGSTKIEGNTQIGSLDLGSGTQVDIKGTKVTLGGTDGSKDLIKSSAENVEVKIEGTTENPAVLNIGNADGEYKLNANVDLQGKATLKVQKGKTEIDGTLNMDGGEVAVAKGASLIVNEIALTENATGNVKVSGKIITEKLAGKSGKVITVGNANAAGHVTAKETQLKGGTLFLDPPLVNGVGIEGATHYATETTDLDGAYVVGQNSILTFGATNEDADTQFKTSGLKWGESNITAAAYVAKNINVAGGSLTVDGAKTTAPAAPAAGTVNLAANSLLMVQGEKITSTAAISGVKSVYVANTAHVFIQGAKPETTYKILAGTGIERTFAEENVALPGTIKDATVELDESHKYLNITTGELKFSSQNTVMPNVGEELVQSGNEQFAQMIDTLPEQQTANVNAYANLGENLGVSRGAYDVANMVGDAIDNHWDTHHEAKDVWAAGTRDKVRVDGVELGGMEAQYDAQYNGAVVGVNLSGNFGMAINYTDGKINNRLGGHNDAEYYGGSLYAKTDWGNLRIAMDATYTYGENELSQNGITADAKTETISGGLTAKYLAKAGLCKIGPFAGIRYIHIDGKDYIDSLGVNREADKINSMVVPVGLEFTGDFEMPGSAWTFRPVLIAGYLFNFGDRNNKMFMRYNEAMDTFGYDLVDKGAFFARAGMNFSKKNFTLGISYDIMKSKNSEYDRWNINADVAF